MQKQSTLTYRWFDEVWNQGIENAIDKYLDTDAVVHGIEGISEPGPEGFKIFYQDGGLARKMHGLPAGRMFCSHFATG